MGLARALAADPPVMLMDEPFGALDPITRGRIQDEFLGLQETIRKTVIFVTHDIDEAIRMGDRIAVLREGGILAQYSTADELLSRPADEYVARFVGADRGLKRLSLRTVGDLEGWRDGGAARPGAPTVTPATTLRVALSALLDLGADELCVEDDGRRVGRVTLQQLHEALASSSSAVGSVDGAARDGDSGIAAQGGR